MKIGHDAEHKCIDVYYDYARCNYVQSVYVCSHDGVESFDYAHADSGDAVLNDFECFLGVVIGYCVHFAEYDVHCVSHGHYHLRLTT